MPIVDVPGIGRVSFLDDMTEDDISNAIDDHFKQVGVEQSIRAATLPSDILNAPGVAEASAGARAEHRRQRIADVRALQEQRLPAAWTLQPETIAGIEQGVRPFLNPPRAVVQAGINAVAAGQRALGLPSYDTEAPILPPGVAQNVTEAAANLIPGESYGEFGTGVKGAASDLLAGLKPADITMLTPAGSMGFATEMAHGAPEATAAAAEALGRGDTAEATKQLVNAGFGVLGPRGIFKHLAGNLPVQPETPAYNGVQIPTPRGAYMPPESAEIARNTPSAAAMLENQMQREATGVDFNPARRYPKATVPEGPIAEEPAKGIAEPEEKAIGLSQQAEIARRANARTKEEIRKLFPNMNRQQAAEVRDVAWGSPQQLLEAKPLENAPGTLETEGVNKALAEDKANAEGIRSDQGQPSETGTPPEGGEADSGGNVEQPPPRGPEPVEPGEAPSEKEVTPPAPEAPPAETAPQPELAGLGDDIKSFLDQQAEAALKRISERAQSAMGGTASMRPDAGLAAGFANLGDYSVYAAAKLAKYGVRGAEWTADMIKTFGEGIKPHLDELHKAAVDYITNAREQVKAKASDYTDLARAAAMSPQQLIDATRKKGAGVTEGAYELGEKLTPENRAEALKHEQAAQDAWPEMLKRSQKAREDKLAALKSGDQQAIAKADAEGAQAMNEALAMQMKKQFFNEAVRMHDAIEAVKGGRPVNEVAKEFFGGEHPQEINHLQKYAKPAAPAEPPSAAPVTAAVAPESSLPAPPPEPPPTDTRIDPNAVPTQEIPINKIKLSADVPNFKGGASEETGTVAGQELSGKYERRGTAPIVVWQRLNGDLEVITGRHRLDLARRTGEKTIPGQIVKEADGFTKDQAITFDAEANIRDGQGEVSDYATYFKGTDISEAEARARGLLSRAKGKAGWVLAKAATDDLYASWRAGHVNDAQAVAIAEGAPGNAGAQRAGIKLAREGKPAEVISGVLRRASQVTGKAENLDLFGADDTAIRQMEADEAKASGIRKGIKDQITAVQGAAKKPEAAAKLGVNVKDPGAVLRKVNELKDELDRWANWWLHPDLVEQVRPTEKPKVEAKKPTPKAGGDLFGSDTPFNLTGETQTAPKPKPTVEPKVELTGFGNETLAQHELFSIEKVVESKDPTKSADAAQKLYGGARDAAIKLEQQLATIDKDPKVAKTFTKPQREMLGNVIALLRERAAKEPPTIHDALNKAAEDALARIDARMEKARGTTYARADLGLAHLAADIKDWGIFGAARLAKFGLDKAAWTADMVKTFTKRILPHIDAVYQVAQDHYRAYKEQYARTPKPTGIQDIINQATGAGGEPITSASHAIDALQSGLRTVRALQDYFKRQPSVSKAEVKVADNWLEADANRIREGLTELVKKELPPEERGRFITAINNAAKRSPILTGDPEAMYRRAAEVAARIEDRAQEVRKANTIQNLKTTVSRALSSPSVDIGYKNRILDLLKRINFTRPTAETLASLKATRDYIDRMAAEGKDVEIPREILDHLDVLTKVPIRDLPIDAVRALADKISRLEQLGRLKVKARAEAWEIEKRGRMAGLEEESTTPLEKRPQFMQQPGDTLPPSIKIRNWLNRALNAASFIDKAYLPIDAVFDMLGDSKGTYRGWLFRQIRGPLDLAFNEYSVLRDKITDPINDLVKKYKMGQKEAERINTYARAMQEGGIERLIAQGVDPKTIDKIIETFTPEERHVYSEMRKAMDTLLPDMQKLMHELYNIEVKPVENYWPLPRDWESMREMLKPEDMKEPTFGEPMTFDDLAGWKDMFADFVSPKTTKTEQGATIERKPKAMTPVQNNAFDVFYQHINDVAYLLKTQRDLKMAGEMARTDAFAEKYGKLGQSLVLDWLDTFARQGRLGGMRRIPWLDQLRTRTAVGIIGFRVASNLVHASNVAFSIERAGMRNYSAAMAEIASGRADEFMHKNFAEAFSRGGGEPGLVEAAAKDQSVFGKTIVPKEVARASMAAARAIDRINAEATMLGVYFKELRRKGIDPATYKDIPIDREAQAYAMVMARRAVASPLPKDVPSAISRGTLTGGNISVGKSVMQFQNIFADQWSNLRYDLWRAGIRQKDPVRAARMMLAVMGVIALETGIREGVKGTINSFTGKKTKEEDLQGAVERELIRRFPLGGQATAAILYDSSGVPMIDSFWDPMKEAYRSAKAKNPVKQNQHAVRALTGAGQLMGLPVGQLGEIVSDSMSK